jgi:hypothetical protein
LDPGSAVEAGAGTDSAGTEVVTDTAIVVVVTAYAGGTGGCRQTKLRTGEVKDKVTDRSGEGPTGGPDRIDAQLEHEAEEVEQTELEELRHQTAVA